MEDNGRSREAVFHPDACRERVKEEEEDNN